MRRVIIVVSGEVQRVGYRDVVEKIARKLKLVGFVENLKPYDVKVIAEGKEEVLKKFIERIDVKRYPIDVEKVVVRFEEPTGEFEYFEIKRGEWHEELGERMDVAGTFLYKSVNLGERSVELGEKSVKLSERSVELGETSVELGEKSVKLSEKSVELGEKSVKLSEKSVELGEKSVNIGERMLDKQDKMHGKLDLIHNDLSVNLKEFHQDTVARFDVVDQKYGKISENMGLIFNEMKEERFESRKSMEKLIGAIVRLAEKK